MPRPVTVLPKGINPPQSEERGISYLAMADKMHMLSATPE